MAKWVHRIEDFRGVARDAHESRLPTDQFQVDENSDHFERATWKVRRGSRRTTADRITGAIGTIFGMEDATGGYPVIILVQNTVAEAYVYPTGLSIQSDPADDSGEGFGEGGFGEGEFGG